MWLPFPEASACGDLPFAVPNAVHEHADAVDRARASCKRTEAKSAIRDFPSETIAHAPIELHYVSKKKEKKNGELMR